MRCPLQAPGFNGALQLSAAWQSAVESPGCSPPNANPRSRTAAALKIQRSSLSTAAGKAAAAPPAGFECGLRSGIVSTSQTRSGLPGESGPAAAICGTGQGQVGGSAAVGRSVSVAGLLRERWGVSAGEARLD